MKKSKSKSKKSKFKFQFDASINASRVEFKSIKEMYDWGTNKENVLIGNMDVWDTWYNRRPTDWTNNHTMETITRAMSNPPEVGAEVRRMVDNITENLHDRIGTVQGRVIRNRRDEGDELDPQSWIRRELDGWSRVEKIHKPGRVIRIGVNIGMNGDKRQSSLYPRGAAAVALADALSSAGHSVELVCAMYCQGVHKSDGYEKQYLVETIVKQAHEPMDVDSAALILSDIGFFRRVGTCSLVASAKKKIIGGTALACDMNENKEAVAQYDVFIDGIWTQAQAEDLIDKYIGKWESE